MHRSWLDFWVGLFVALGIAALVFVALRVANQTTLVNGQTYTVTAYFNNIGGLKVRSPVKSSGVVVGRVTAIRLDSDNYQAKVSLALDQKITFSKDVSASILTAGLLGEQYISLDAGGDTEELIDGDTIHLTSSALVLEDLIGKFALDKANSQTNRN